MLLDKSEIGAGLLQRVNALLETRRSRSMSKAAAAQGKGVV